MQVLEIIDVQWDTLHVDMHAAAYLLNPRDHQLLPELVTERRVHEGAQVSAEAAAS